jgi:hypothetical protein
MFCNCVLFPLLNIQQRLKKAATLRAEHYAQFV